MPGQNAFAFNGTAFVPTDRNLTAAISAFSPASVKKGVTRVYTVDGGPPATQVWQGFPPIPTAPTYTNVRTGTFPNLANSIRVNWTADESTITASFDVFVKIGTGTYSLAGNVGASLRTFTYGNISANTTYSFYVRANGVSGLNSVGPESSTSLPGAPAASTNFRETSTSPSSITWTWDFPAGTFQRFYVYRGGTYNAEVLPTQSATSATHTWSGLSENSSYTLSIQGQNYDGFWSPIIADSASTTNAAPSTPSVSASKVAVASTPVVRTSTNSTQTRSFTVTVTPAADPLFAEVYLEVSSDNVNWSALTSWTDNTNTKTYTHSISTTGAITRYYRVRQRDNQNLYSVYSSSVSATSDEVWSATEYIGESAPFGSGSETNYYYGYDSDNGQTLSVVDWAVTSTFNNDVQTYGGDQAFDSDLSKAWRSASTTNARIRIEFNNPGNWVNGLSAVRIRTAAAYTYYLQIGYMSGTSEVWFNGSGGVNAPGTTSPYVETGTTTAVSMTTIDINPDRMVLEGSAGSSSYRWLMRFVFTAGTARTFEVNEITPKMRRQNYATNPVYATYYW